MRRISRNGVRLDRGDTLPFICRKCGHMFPARPGAICGRCPKCGTVTASDEVIFDVLDQTPEPPADPDGGAEG